MYMQGGVIYMNIKKLAQKFEATKNRVCTTSSLQITHDGQYCEVIAEGCRRVLTCDEVMVVFENAAGKRVCITGVGLKLRNWGSTLGGGVVISGDVKSVEIGGIS